MVMDAMLVDLWSSASSGAGGSLSFSPNDYGTAFFFGSSELSFKKTSHYKSRAFAPSDLFDSLSSPAHARPGGSSTSGRKVQKRKDIAFSLLASSSPTHSGYIFPRAKKQKQKIVQRAQPGYKFACLPCAKYYIRRQDLKKHYTLFHDGAVPPSFELVLDPMSSSGHVEEMPALSSSPMDLAEALQIPSSPPEISQGDSSFVTDGVPSSPIPAQYLPASPMNAESTKGDSVLHFVNLSMDLPALARLTSDSPETPPSAEDQGMITEQPPCKQEELDFINFTTASDISMQQGSSSSGMLSSTVASTDQLKSTITKQTSPLSRFTSIQPISLNENKAEQKRTKDEEDKPVLREPAPIIFTASERILTKSDSETSLEDKEASFDAEYKPVFRTSTRVRNRSSVASVTPAEPRITRTRTKIASALPAFTSAIIPDISTAEPIYKARKQSTAKAKPRVKRSLPALSKEESVNIESNGDSYSCKFCKKSYVYLRSLKRHQREIHPELTAVTEQRDQEMM